MLWPRRQVWCPRCDELRGARPGSPCPVCAASMVGLPQVNGTSALRASRADLVKRLGSLLPAARVVAVTAVTAALVAGAFAAGRSSRPEGTAAAASPTTTTSDGQALPGGGLSTDVSREFGWSARHGNVTLTLNRITATRRTTQISFEVSGLERDWALAGVGGLRLADSSGRELLVVGGPTPLTSSDLEGGDGGAGTVELTQRIDPNAVASATVTEVIALRHSSESLRGTLVDAELKHQVDTSPQNDLDRQGDCAACTLEVRCTRCETVEVMGSSYRDGRVVVLLSQEGRPMPGETLADADIAVSTGGPGGQVGSFESTAEGGDTVVEFAARDLAASTPRGQQRMSFEVAARVMQMQTVPGSWRLDQHGGQR